MNSAADRETLNGILLAAHANGDVLELMKAYEAAASAFEQADDIEAAAFFRTHALIFALEAGAEEAIALEDWLRLNDRM